MSLWAAVHFHWSTSSHRSTWIVTCLSPDTCSCLNLWAINCCMRSGSNGTGTFCVVFSLCSHLGGDCGFFLSSLTKYMPVCCLILVSSVAFALAHYNMQNMLPLVLLGVVMGAVFARSRNLLASMLLRCGMPFVFLEVIK